MSLWMERPERWLIALVLGMLALVLVGEAHHYSSIEPVALPTLLFELLEVVLLVGCAVACTLSILRVRAREMVAAAVVMLAVLLAGELYLGADVVTPPMLLVELLEVALLAGSAVAWVLLARRIA